MIVPGFYPAAIFPATVVRVLSAEKLLVQVPYAGEGSYKLLPDGTLGPPIYHQVEAEITRTHAQNMQMNIDPDAVYAEGDSVCIWGTTTPDTYTALPAGKAEITQAFKHFVLGKNL